MRSVGDAHFDEGVGVSVGVHGGQVSAADHTHDQAALLTAVHQRYEDATALLGVLGLVPLHTHTQITV